jgi:outer membrane protein assembly factor BamB
MLVSKVNTMFRIGWFIVLFVPCIFAQSTFHGDLARSGVFDSLGPKQLKGVKWAFKTGGPVLSSPIIAGGVVFVGSGDGNVYAIEQETGKEKWSFKTTEPVSSSPAVADGIVYFSSYEGVFYALDANTGAVKWRFATEQERRFQARGIHGTLPGDQTIPDPFDFFTSSPAVFKGRVYFGAGDGNVYCLDAHSGVLVWKYATNDVVHASPSIANNTVYIGSWDSYFYALDAETGQERWRYKAGEDPVIHNQIGFQSSAAVVNGTVYVGCRDGHVYALDAATGRKKWDYSTSQSWVNTTPAVYEGVVYVGTCDSHRFHALDAKTGTLRFMLDTRACLVSSPALAGNLVYIGSFNGRLYAIDVTSGKISSEFQTEASRQDRFKVLEPDGSFTSTAYAPFFHDFEDMYVGLSRTFSVGAIISSPVVDKNKVYVGSTDGYLYAIE